MKNFKKIFAIVLVAVMVLSFCGCHKKGEIAIKIGDVSFTSAYYMCALLEADMDARQQIDTKAKSDDSIDTSKEGYYYSQKIDGKKYVTYVKDTALDRLKTLASYKIKAKEAKLKISDEQQSTIDTYVSYYWNSYGYSALYEPNGVSKDTFAEFFRDSYYSDLYFDYLYGKDGEKAISDDEITAFMNENYVLADVLSEDLSSKEEAEVTAITEQFDEFYSGLKSNKVTFNEVYETYNKTEEGQKQESYSTVLGSSKTDNADENFDTIKAMAVGEVKLIKAEDGSKITLVVKKDLSADETQKENLDETIRHNLKGEEFEADIEVFKKTLKVNENKSATKQFNIKKIEYPQQSAT